LAVEESYAGLHSGADDGTARGSALGHSDEHDYDKHHVVFSESEEEQGSEECVKDEVDGDEEDELLSIISSSESAANHPAIAACSCPFCFFYSRIIVDCSCCLLSKPLLAIFAPSEAAYCLDMVPMETKCRSCRELGNQGALPQHMNKYGQCEYCHKLGMMTIEHIQPRSKGGNSAPDNLARVCKPCNSARGNQTFADFLAQLRASERPWRADNIEKYFERRGISWTEVDARSAQSAARGGRAFKYRKQISAAALPFAVPAGGVSDMPTRFESAVQRLASRQPDARADEIRAALATVRTALGDTVPRPAPPASHVHSYVPLSEAIDRIEAAADRDVTALCAALGLTGDEARLKNLLCVLTEQCDLIDVRAPPLTASSTAAAAASAQENHIRWIQDWEQPALEEQTCLAALRELFQSAWHEHASKKRGGFMFLVHLSAHLNKTGLRGGLSVIDLANAFGKPPKPALKAIFEFISVNHPDLVQMHQARVPGMQHMGTEVRWSGVGNDGWN
jgi:hypothetical protein